MLCSFPMSLLADIAGNAVVCGLKCLVAMLMLTICGSGASQHGVHSAVALWPCDCEKCGW